MNDVRFLGGCFITVLINGHVVDEGDEDVYISEISKTVNKYIMIHESLYKVWRDGTPHVKATLWYYVAKKIAEYLNSDRITSSGDELYIIVEREV